MMANSSFDVERARDSAAGEWPVLFYYANLRKETQGLFHSSAMYVVFRSLAFMQFWFQYGSPLTPEIIQLSKGLQIDSLV
jgi:hypothetical protein